MKTTRRPPGPRLALLLRWAERLNEGFWNALARGADTRGLANRAVRTLRILVLSALSFTVNEVPVRAAALVFTTLLAFIPLTIILSSIAGWLGYLGLLLELIPEIMASLNLDLPVEPLMRSIERAESLGFHQLGLLGTAGLLIGFLLSMSNIEEAMNRVWNVRKGRGWLGRLGRYTPFLVLLLAVVLVSVFLLFRARQILDAWGFGPLLSFDLPGGALLFGSLGALVFMWMVMVLMIRLLPNTRVRLSSALLGATAGIVPLYLLSRVLFLFPAAFIARNQLFYGSLAIFPVALLLVYLFWICVLFGSTVAFVQARLENDLGTGFFARGAGLREDWDAALRETAALYRKRTPAARKPSGPPEGT